jgi:hypothetical protein
VSQRPSRPLLRVGVALQAILLLAIQLVDGSGVQRCPDHDVGVGVLAVGAAPMAGHHHGGHDDGSSKHQGLCPCLAPCHSPSAALVPTGTVALIAVPIHAVGFAPVFTPTIRQRNPQLLPFALGPPRIA